MLAGLTAMAPAKSQSSSAAPSPQTPASAALARTRQPVPATVPPKDTIPVTKTPPRKQRSSRIQQAEHVDIEPLPAFGEVPVGDRSQLFVHKLRLCSVVFDFNDP